MSNYVEKIHFAWKSDIFCRKNNWILQWLGRFPSRAKKIDVVSRCWKIFSTKYSMVICPQDSLPHNFCLFQPCLLGILPEQGGIDAVSPPKRPSPKTSIQDHILPLCNQVSEAKFSHKQDSKLKLSIRWDLWQNYRINFWLDPKQRESTVGNENTLNMAPKDPM